MITRDQLYKAISIVLNDKTPRNLEEQVKLVAEAVETLYGPIMSREENLICRMAGNIVSGAIAEFGKKNVSDDLAQAIGKNAVKVAVAIRMQVYLARGVPRA